MKTLLAFAVFAALHTAGAGGAQAAGRSYEISGSDWPVPASVVADIRRQLQAAADGAVAASATKEQRSVLHDIIQYEGIHLRGEGSKRTVVDVWGMCKTDWSPAMLRRNIAVGRDGGNCYYYARYDPAAKKFTDFIFNGAS